MAEIISEVEGSIRVEEARLGKNKSMRIEGQEDLRIENRQREPVRKPWEKRLSSNSLNSFTKMNVPTRNLRVSQIQDERRKRMYLVRSNLNI